MLFFACRQANLFDSLLFTCSGCLALLCCLLHARPLSGTHSRSLSLELSRAYTFARAHLLVVECLFLHKRVPLFAGWPEISLILADRLVSLFT